MARKRKGRNINGVLLLDKPTAMTSNDLLQQIRCLFQAQKAGHTGALDPLATGMLPICFGESTKFSQFLLDSDKRYRVIAKLGFRTDTSDSDGHIISERRVDVTVADIKKALLNFQGEVMQIPTMFSALKHQGRPLYEYARKGITIEREARSITIYENHFIQFENNELELDIHCSKGTYIRTIIDDLGELLGCGAHVINLRRTQVSTYPTEKMVTLSYLKTYHNDLSLLDSLLLPTDSPIQHYEKIVLTQEQGNKIQLGQTIYIDNFQRKTGLFRLYQQEQFIGIGLYSENLLSPKRLVNNEI